VPEVVVLAAVPVVVLEVVAPVSAVVSVVVAPAVAGLGVVPWEAMVRLRTERSGGVEKDARKQE